MAVPVRRWAFPAAAVPLRPAALALSIYPLAALYQCCTGFPDMKKLIAAFILFAGLSGTALAASSSFLGTLPTTGNTAAFAGWCVGGTGANCAGGVFWPGTVIANSSGTELFTSANLGLVDSPTGSNLSNLLAAPVPFYSVASYGTSPCASYTAGNNPVCGNPKGALFESMVDWAGTTLGAPSNYGTSPGAVEVPGVNAFVTNPITSQFSTNNTATTPHICGSSAHYQASSNSDLTVVPVSGSTNIYVCDYSFEFTGVGAFYFESATTAASSGSTCSGSLTQLADNTWTGQASNPIGKSGANAFYRGLNTGASHGLCLHTTALSATTLDVTVYYDQY